MIKGQRIAFLGVGLMGAPMAANLLKSGHKLNVWNRSPHNLERLARSGATICKSPAETVADARYVILMLADGAAVEEVLFAAGLANAAQDGTIVIDMSSIPPDLAADHSRRLKQHGICYLDSPVSGGTAGAKTGTLAIFAGGPKTAFDDCRPIFEPLGNASYMGASGSGQITKLASQIIVAISIGAVAEGLLFASAAGADPRQVRKALQGGFADSKILELHGERMLNREFIPGGPNRIFLKDIKTAANSLHKIGLDLPQFSRALAQFHSLNATGKSEYDHSSLLLALEDMNPGQRLTDAADIVPATKSDSPRPAP